MIAWSLTHFEAPVNPVSNELWVTALSEPPDLRPKHSQVSCLYGGVPRAPFVCWSLGARQIMTRLSQLIQIAWLWHFLAAMKIKKHRLRLMFRFKLERFKVPKAWTLPCSALKQWVRIFFIFRRSKRIHLCASAIGWLWIFRMRHSHWSSSYTYH